MRKRILALGLFVALLALAGCDWFSMIAPLDIAPADQTIYVADALGGALATLTFTSPGDTTIDFGDGSATSSLGDSNERVTVTHIYKKATTFNVLFFHNDSTVGTATVTVKANMPSVMEPARWPWLYCLKGEEIQMQVDRVIHGCDRPSGNPYYTNGILEGDGITEYRLTVVDQDGRDVPAFDPDAPLGSQYVSGEWLILTDADPYHRLSVIAGWYETVPNHPLEDALGALGCGDTCPDPGPWPDPDVPPTPGMESRYLRMDFRLEARNQYTMPGDEAYVTWSMWMERRNCS